MSPTGTSGDIQVRYTTAGYEAVAASMQGILQQLRKVDTETKRTTRSGTELGRSFRNIALRTIAIIGIVRSFRLVTGAIRDAVGAGIEYNATIEQSRLAIASLITAQADLVTATGEHLQGVEALDAAYELATDQVRKLRIAGIQTAATTKELVDAFQQAVGAGTAAGLTLDEIRVFTIRIAQAAGALGVPYRQLNEEIRSLLGGIIDQNTRIAKSLQITNDQVRAAKEQNRLADFLNEKFAAFGVAGERIVKTWNALKSNVKETLELLSGEITKPLFEALRTRGQASVQKIFDFDTAALSKDFAQIVKTLQDIFRGIGDQIAGTIESAVSAAARLNSWLIENHQVVRDTADEIGQIASGIGELIGGVGRVALGTAKWATEMGIVAQIAETISDTLKTIGRSPVLSAGVLVGGLVGLAAAFTAIVGSTAAIATGGALVIGALVAAIDHFTYSVSEAIEATTKFHDRVTQTLEASSEEARIALQLADDYKKLNDALKEGRVEAGRVQDVRRQMASILGQLTRMNTSYAEAVKKAADMEGDYVENVREVIKARREAITVEMYRQSRQIEDANRRLAPLVAEQGAVEAKAANAPKGTGWAIGFSDWATGGVKRTNQIKALDDQVQTLLRNRAALQDEIDLIDKLLGMGSITPEGRSAEDKEKALKALRAAVDLELARIKRVEKEQTAALKAQFDENEISYVEYYDRLAEIQQTSINEQIAQYQRLVNAEDDAQKKAGANVKIIELESDRKIKAIENEVARRQAGLKFAEESSKLEVQYLEAVGQKAEAQTKKLEDEYRDYLERMKTMGERGQREIARVNQFIAISVARSSFQEIEAEVQRIQNATRDRIAEIQATVEVGGLLPQEGQLRIADEYERMIMAIAGADENGKSLLSTMEQLANVIQDPDTVAQVEALKSQLRELGLTVIDLRDGWKQWKQDVKSAATSDIAKYLSDAVTEADSLRSAFTNLAGSIANLRNLFGTLAASIVEATARMIAMKIVEASMTALFGVPGAKRGGYVDQGTVTADLGVPAATGGFIRGPGGPTSDLVFARLSAGEYVVRAAAVDKYGVDFLHLLNRGAVPRQVIDLKKYATGGIVNETARTSLTATKDLHGELTIGLSDGLVVNQMNTPAGERLVLKIISKNRRGILQQLGL